MVCGWFLDVLEAVLEAGWSLLSIHVGDADVVIKVLWDWGRFLRLPLKRGEKSNTNGFGDEMGQEKSLELRFKFIFFLSSNTCNLIVLILAWFPEETMACKCDL